MRERILFDIVFENVRSNVRVFWYVRIDDSVPLSGDFDVDYFVIMSGKSSVVILVIYDDNDMDDSKESVGLVYYL